MRDFDQVCDLAEPHGGPPDAPMGAGGAEPESAPRPHGGFVPPADLWKATLERVIQADVLPRLLINHALQPRASSSRPGHGHGAPASIYVGDLVALLLQPDGDAALEYVVRLKLEIMSEQSLLLDLLAPAARRLGALWSDDRCDFMEVTVGLQRLHQCLRLVNPGKPVRTGAWAARLLLSPAPGETHVFGVAIVERFFQAAGWDVAQANENDFAQLLAASWFDVVGFSLSQDRSIEGLEDAIAEARGRSRNPDLRVLVGGPVFIDRPELVGKIGADAMATDAVSAVLRAENLLDRQVLV